MLKNVYLLGLLSLMIVATFLSAPSQSASTTRIKVVARVDRTLFKPASVETLGGKVLYTAELAPIVVLEVPKEAVKALSRLPGILHWSLDGPVRALKGKPSSPPGRSKEQPPQEIPWGIDRINAPEAWTYTRGWVDVNGDGDSEIEVAVIDTGVDRDHPDLAGNVKWCIAVLNGRISTRCDDRNGHGTHVSGTIAALDNEIGVVGAAPSVELYIIKALNNAGYGTWSDLVIAIDLAVKGPDGVVDSDGDGIAIGDPDDDAPEVISMSLGGSSPPEEVYEVIVAAYSWNITIVAAAGNEGSETPLYPAAYAEVIAVGAVDQNDQVPDWSNRNPELVAPGVEILSTYPDDTYETLSGTSMACPHVSGTVALIQAARMIYGLPLLPPGNQEDLTADSVRGVLHITADEGGVEGYDPLYGYGIVRADLAVKTAIGASG
ncbi:MAG: peptidase S8 [Thermoprotei archaeon]|nr:MAG: peptidase S8 [Thermoprotei archaeon]